MTIHDKDGQPEKDPYWDTWGFTSIEPFQKFVSAIELEGTVFEDVRLRFEVIKRLLLYSYYEHQFTDVAFDHSLVTFEMALARRYYEIEGRAPKSKEDPKRDMGLKELITWGTRQLLFEDDEPISRSLRGLRNRSAHTREHKPLGYLAPDAVAQIADIINGLYDNVDLRRARRRMERTVNKSFNDLRDQGAILEIDGNRYLIFFASLMHYENRGAIRTYHSAFWPIFDPSKCSTERFEIGEPIVVPCHKHSTNGFEHNFSDCNGRKIVIKKIENTKDVATYQEWLKFFKSSHSPFSELIDLEIAKRRAKLKSGFAQRFMN